MKTMLMAIMAVVVAVAFSAPSFAEETAKKKDAEKKGHVVYAEEKKEKKDEKKPHADTFADEKKKDEKEKGK